MNGQALIDLMTSVFDGESPDPTYLLQLINLSRIKYESMRAWMVLKTKDSSLSVNSSNKYTTPFTLPTNFRRFLGESSLKQGLIRLFDGSNNLQYLEEIPYEQVLEYKDQFGYFAVDYGNRQFYIMGTVPGSFTMILNYIKKTDAITLANAWANFDSDYHPMLAFDAAARWRLGTDYDDMNQRNADDNAKLANGIFEAAVAEDTERAIGSINNIEYPSNIGSDRGSTGFGPRGARA